MTQDIEPLTYQHRTNIDEHRQFFAKINEIIANLAPTVAEAEEAIAQANAAITQANESLAAVQASASDAAEAAANAALSAGSASEAAGSAAEAAATAQSIAGSRQPVKTPVTTQIVPQGIYLNDCAVGELIAGWIKFYDDNEGQDLRVFVSFALYQTTMSESVLIKSIPVYPAQQSTQNYLVVLNSVNRVVSIRNNEYAPMAGITINEVSLSNYH